MLLSSTSVTCMRHRLLSFLPFRSFHAIRPCRQFMVPKSVIQHQQGRSIMRLVQFYRKKFREIWFEPLRVVYQKDGVSRARNILIYKGQRNIVVPALGIFNIFLCCILCDTIYHVYYLEVRKQDPDYDPYEYAEFYLLIPMTGGLCYLVFCYRVLTRYITRVYYNEPKKLFTLTTYNVLMPWRTDKRVVRAGTGRLLSSVKDDEYSIRFTYNCSVDGRKYLLYPEFFKYPVYFNVLFGYEDPEAIAKLNDSDENVDQIFRDRAHDDDY